jgi:hypothetical protein
LPWEALPSRSELPRGDPGRRAHGDVKDIDHRVQSRRIIEPYNPHDPMSTPHFPIYMDYSATNPCDPRVVDAMIPWLREHFGNPASRSHAWGWEAERPWRPRVNRSLP